MKRVHLIIVTIRHSQGVGRVGRGEGGGGSQKHPDYYRILASVKSQARRVNIVKLHGGYRGGNRTICWLGLG